MRRFCWVVFLILDFLLVVAFLGGFLGRYVQPTWDWWIQLLAIALPYVSIALIPVAFIALYFGKWKLRLLHSALLIMIVVRFGPALPSSKSSTTMDSAETLKVLTLNARGRHNNPKARDKMLALMKQEQPHVLSLQEIVFRFISEPPGLRGSPHILVLLDSLGYDTIRSEEGKPKYHQPILTILPQEELTQTEIRGDVGEALPGLVTRTVVKWQEQDIAVYNIHLLSFAEKPWQGDESRWFNLKTWLAGYRNFRRDFKTRAREATRIRKMLDEESNPFIVTGDFNSTPHNWAYYHLAQGLQDTFLEAGNDWGATYHSRQPMFRIDYVLASSDWQVVQTYPIEGNYSDHKPLVAHLKLRAIN